MSIYQISNVFHRAILAFFTLILLAGCGYKDDPFYENTPTKGESKREAMNKF